MRYLPSVFLLLAGLGLSACAVPRQLELIEREQRRLRIDYGSIREELDNARSSLADTRANFSQLQSEISVLRGRVEEVENQTGRQIDQSTQEGVRRLRDMERQLAKLEDEVKNQSEVLKAREAGLRSLEEELRSLKETVAARQEEREAALSTARTADEVSRSYEEAFSFVEQKDYRVAIARLGDFLKKYPNSDYADNAQYWIGESHYALREFDQAILAFDVVRREYPRGDKVPAALLKMGFAFAELGEKVDARIFLQEVIDRYPQSEEAVKANQRLKSL